MLDGKGIAALIISRHKKPKESEQEEQEERDDDRYEDTAREMMEALDAKNPALFAAALKMFVSMCGHEEEY